MTIIDDTQHWRQRAQEAREAAAQIGDPVAKAAMLTIAQSYEEIASRADARLLKSKIRLGNSNG